MDSRGLAVWHQTKAIPYLMKLSSWVGEAGGIALWGNQAGKETIDTQWDVGCRVSGGSVGAWGGIWGKLKEIIRPQRILGKGGPNWGEKKRMVLMLNIISVFNLNEPTITRYGFCLVYTRAWIPSQPLGLCGGVKLETLLIRFSVRFFSVDLAMYL